MDDSGASQPFRPDTLQGTIKILVELRACSHGFAGIPQETRLIYSVFSEIANFQVGGLLNPFHDLVLPRAMRRHGHRDAKHPAKRIFNQARLITAMDAEIEGKRRKDIIARWTRRLDERDLLPLPLRYLRSGKYYPLLPLSGVTFDDFVWTKFFQKTLPSVERERIIQDKFFTIRKGWAEAHSWCQSRRLSVKIDTQGWQFFVCQVPTPFVVHPETKIVVRYHDAIPLFLPHTTSVGAPDLKRHFRGLRASVRNGAFFVCTSEPIRDHLVNLFPEAEPNTAVIPDIVSNEYHRDQASPEGLARIIHLRKCPETAPRLQTAAPKSLTSDYVLSVSTLEPRKNYKLLLEAWEMACQRLESRPILVLVANVGWRNGEEIEEIRKLVKAKRVAHLSRVALHELRALYSGAHGRSLPEPLGRLRSLRSRGDAVRNARPRL
jgi:glycosyltransferase involved in cell wall biosynthesis